MSGLAEDAENTAVAQLAIVRALKPLGPMTRQRVIEAVRHLLEAEACVPGVLERFLGGRA